VQGEEVIIEFEADVVGQRETMQYTGKLDGPGKISGKVKLGDRTGTFTGRKK
jgi:hypothetical protein